MLFYTGIFGFDVGIRQNIQKPEIIGFSCSFFPSQKLFPVIIGFLFCKLATYWRCSIPSVVHLSMARDPAFVNNGSS